MSKQKGTKNISPVERFVIKQALKDGGMPDDIAKELERSPQAVKRIQKAMDDDEQT